MNTKLITFLTLGALPLVGAAMPTKAELDKVSPVVMDLMRPDQEALKAGKKTKSEVAAAALDLVAKADGEAAKLLLTKGAYNLYVRAGDFEKAIETLKSFREIVPDMEPQYLANIIESSLRTISRKNGGQLYQLLAETRTLARYRDELKKLEAQVKKDATDKTLQLKLAEHCAVLGDWPKALDAFAKSSDRKAAEMAKMEKSVSETPSLGDAVSSPRQKENNPSIKSAADYWWNYSTRKSPDFEKPFRQHAARLYEKAIASGELVGLNKVQADRRIEEANALGETVYEAPATKDGLYCVIDLSGGPNAKHYPVSYLNAVPKGGWTDEYKSTKLVLRRVEMRGKPDYYLGVFEVTGNQWSHVMGRDPSRFGKVKNHPVEQVSYQDIRGKEKGSAVPVTGNVDADSFLGKLRERSKINFDLPHEDQWEYACRAGSTGKWGAPAVDDIEKFKMMAWYGNSQDAKANDPGNAGGCTHGVGERLPNAWGFYDMHGNVGEWTVDARNENPAIRALRGGSWWFGPDGCSMSYHWDLAIEGNKMGSGFRLAIQPK